MATKPTKCLLDTKSTETPQKINLDIQSRSEVNPEDCPWVKLGQLYVSVTIIGDTSWLPLIALLREGKSPVSKFSVITGRHGDIPNRYGPDGTYVDIMDSAHVEEDKKVKEQALREFKGIEIDLVDAGQAVQNQTGWLRLTTKSLIAERTVIYGWCYGIFSMCIASTSLSASDLQQRQNWAITTPINELVKAYWDWVPGL